MSNSGVGIFRAIKAYFRPVRLLGIERFDHQRLREILSVSEVPNGKCSLE